MDSKRANSERANLLQGGPKMLRVIIVLTVGTLGLAVGQPVSQEDRIWGPTNEGLKISLGSDNAFYSIGDTIRVRVVVFNEGQTRSFFSVSSEPRNVDLEVRREDKSTTAQSIKLRHTQVKAKKAGEQKEVGLEILAHPLKLQQGAEIVLDDFALTDTIDLPGPGVYSVQCVWEPRSTNPTEHSRKILSNEFTITLRQ